MTARHVETLFCDDIREEASGKLILIGVYSDTMLVRRFPAKVQGLCVSVKVVSPVERSLDSLRLEVRLGEQLLRELDVDAEKLGESSRVADAMARSGSGPQFQLGHFMLRLDPIDVAEESVVSVHALTGDEVLYGIPLRIATTSGGH